MGRLRSNPAAANVGITSVAIFNRPADFDLWRCVRIADEYSAILSRQVGGV